MNELFPGYTTLSAFLLASPVPAAKPGPGQVCSVTGTVARVCFGLGLPGAVAGTRSTR